MVVPCDCGVGASKAGLSTTYIVLGSVQLAGGLIELFAALLHLLLLRWEQFTDHSTCSGLVLEINTLQTSWCCKLSWL